MKVTVLNGFFDAFSNRDTLPNSSLMKTAFQAYCGDLDELAIGVMASDAETENITALDGSIVLCHSEQAMRTWLEAHGVNSRVEIDPAYYGGVVASLSEECIPYHMDERTSKRFLALLSRDPRFRPEVLHLEHDSWTLFTSSINLYGDPLKGLKQEIER